MGKKEEQRAIPLPPNRILGEFLHSQKRAEDRRASAEQFLSTASPVARVTVGALKRVRAWNAEQALALNQHETEAYVVTHYLPLASRLFKAAHDVSVHEVGPVLQQRFEAIGQRNHELDEQGMPRQSAEDALLYSTAFDLLTLDAEAFPERPSDEIKAELRSRFNGHS